MKCCVFVLLLIVVNLLQACATVENTATPGSDLHKQIIGKWEATDNGEYGYFYFMINGRADIVVEGVSVTESKLKNQGFMRFKLDTNTQPMALDINAYSPFAEKIGTFKSIIEFVDQDTIKFATNRDNESVRPKGFYSDEADTMIITRIGKEGNIKKKNTLSYEEKRIEGLKYQCNSGRVNSCEQLADIYKVQAGEADKDNKKYLLKQSFIFQQKACEYGFLYACFIVAGYYKEGSVVEKDMTKARQLYRKACSEGRGVVTSCQYQDD